MYKINNKDTRTRPLKKYMKDLKLKLQSDFE